MLPSQVPSPLQSFTEAEITQVEMPDMQQQLRDNNAMVQSAFQQLSAEATGGASLEDFAWAVSVSSYLFAVCAAVYACPVYRVDLYHSPHQAGLCRNHRRRVSGRLCLGSFSEHLFVCYLFSCASHVKQMCADGTGGSPLEAVAWAVSTGSMHLSHHPATPP